MAELDKIISKVITVSGSIKIKALSEKQIQSLSNLTLWDENTPDNKPMNFGGNYFKQSSNEKAIIIDMGEPIFDFELKAMMVAGLHLGTIEGGTPYKWKSVISRVRTLKTFCNFLRAKGYASFRELNDLSELKLRNILNDFLNYPKAQGGMEQRKYTSAAKTLRDATKFLYTYGLISKSLLAPLVDELTISRINKHEDECRLKHSIIPTEIMKSVIKTSSDYIYRAKENIESFIRVHTLANSRIALSEASNPRHAVITANHKLLNELDETYNFVYQLNLHVYTLVLAFTGMRDNEAYELKNHCHSCREETGEDVYTVKSLLSKTTDGVIELDWIANEVVHDAVEVLSRVNDVYRERARLLLKHHKHKMPHSHIKRYKQGLKNNRLFGIRHTKHTTRFIEAARASDANTGISLNRHKFQVTASDIELLEKVGCNYQSVSQQSGKRGLKYKVGDFFNFTAHQFRHTFAWFIIANRLGDLDDIKYQFKHLNRVMTFVYSERGYESLSELRTVIEYFEELANRQAIEDIVESAKLEQVAGGGGDRLSRFLAKLNSNNSQVIFTTAQQPHFNNTQELIEFATKYSDSIRGLPHGYCTKGAGCKIKNASDPSHCLYCVTYYATPKHLPYWKAIKHSCEQKIKRIQSLTDNARYQSFLTGLKDNLKAANEIIDKLTSSTHSKVES